MDGWTIDFQSLGLEEKCIYCDVDLDLGGDDDAPYDQCTRCFDDWQTEMFVRQLDRFSGSASPLGSKGCNLKYTYLITTVWLSRIGRVCFTSSLSYYIDNQIRTFTECNQQGD